jgi:hypothetical protein
MYNALNNASTTGDYGLAPFFHIVQSHATSRIFVSVFIPRLACVNSRCSWCLIFSFFVFENQTQVMEVVWRHQVPNSNKLSRSAVVRLFAAVHIGSLTAKIHTASMYWFNLLVHSAREVILSQFPTGLVVGASVELDTLQVPRNDMLAFSCSIQCRT